MTRFNNTIAMVLGLEINGLNVVRALGRARASVVGVDSDLNQVTALSKYLIGRVETKDIRGEELIQTINTVARDNRIYALFPTMDSTVHCLSENREQLSENVILRLPNKEMVRRMMHKGLFRELCNEYGLNSPGTAVVKTSKEIEPALDALRAPVVMKSVFKKINQGPKAAIVSGVVEAESAYQEMGQGEMIFEEMIPGEDKDVYFCLQAYSKNSDLLGTFTGRKIRQWPPRIGGTASAEPVDLPQLEQKTTEFFKAVGFQGLGSMEYKKDARDGEFYAIEPTVGRTDFQSGVAVANGMNLPLLMMGEMSGTKVRSQKPKKGVKWVHPVADERSALYYMEQGQITRAQWLKSLSGPKVSTLFSMDDPGPWVIDLFRRIKARIIRPFIKKEDGQ